MPENRTLRPRGPAYQAGVVNQLTRIPVLVVSHVMTLQCSCGEDHAGDLRLVVVADLVAQHGETIVVTLMDGRGSWLVPRIWIAFHGLKADEVPELAKWYGWSQCGAGGSNPS